MSNLKGINTEGLLTDIYEDEGYDHWDLLITVLETLCTDVSKCIQEEDKDHLYALINLLDSCDPDELIKFLPKEGTPYDPERCEGLGEYRLNHQNFPADPATTITVSEFVKAMTGNDGGEEADREAESLWADDEINTDISCSYQGKVWNPENDCYFMSHHYPEDYTIPLSINNALVRAMWWANIKTEDSVYKQAALTYLMAVPQAILEGHEMGRGIHPVDRIESGLKTQILYILSNLQGWRGEDARQCKRVLKAFATTNATKNW